MLGFFWTHHKHSKKTKKLPVTYPSISTLNSHKLTLLSSIIKIFLFSLLFIKSICIYILIKILPFLLAYFLCEYFTIIIELLSILNIANLCFRYFIKLFKTNEQSTSNSKQSSKLQVKLQIIEMILFFPCIVSFLYLKNLSFLINSYLLLFSF